MTLHGSSTASRQVFTRLEGREDSEEAVLTFSPPNLGDEHKNGGVSLWRIEKITLQLH
jgi:hypothetical protein